MEAPPPHHTAAYLAANKGPAMLGSVLSVSILSTLFVIARVFTRYRIMAQMHLDDWLTVISQLFLWACVALGIQAVRNGNGRHFDTLTTQQQENAIMYTILNFPFGIMGFGLPKLAVVALLTRILNPSRGHRIFLWTLSTTTLICLLGCVVILFAQCTPSRSQWTFSITEKTCWPKSVLVDYAIFAGGFSACTDLYLAVYPASVLWGLQMNLRKKLALCCALGIGSTATVIAIYKCTQLPSLASPDFSYATSDLVIWTIVEASTIIIASCIPCLQPLVDVLFGRHTLSSAPGYKKYGRSRSGRFKSAIELQESSGNSHSRSRTGTGTLNSSTNKHTAHQSVEQRAAGDSQETILRPEDLKPGQHWATVSRGGNAEPTSQIVRTDEVTVTYNNERKGEINQWGRL